MKKSLLCLAVLLFVCSARGNAYDEMEKGYEADVDKKGSGYEFAKIKRNKLSEVKQSCVKKPQSHARYGMEYGNPKLLKRKTAESLASIQKQIEIEEDEIGYSADRDIPGHAFQN